MTELTKLTISKALDKLRRGDISSLELTEAHLQQIEARDPQIGAYLCVTADLALEQARAADQARAGGEEAALLGIPIALKDVLSTKGIETTCGSKILKGYVPIFDATSVARLYQAGAVMLGKLNMDEFAMGSSTEYSGYFPTRNPWNLEHVPGGSSGGSSAAVAANMAMATLGTDTGGSIRQPASFCGVSAIKPSYGARLPLWLDRLRLLIRSSGTLCAQRRRCGARAPRHRRARSAGFDQHANRGARLSGGVEGRILPA